MKILKMGSSAKYLTMSMKVMKSGVIEAKGENLDRWNATLSLLLK